MRRFVSFILFFVYFLYKNIQMSAQDQNCQIFLSLWRHVVPMNTLYTYTHTQHRDRPNKRHVLWLIFSSAERPKVKINPYKDHKMIFFSHLQQTTSFSKALYMSVIFSDRPYLKKVASYKLSKPQQKHRLDEVFLTETKSFFFCVNSGTKSNIFKLIN